MTSDGATSELQIQNCSFHQFHCSLRNDSVANYGSIWMQFLPSVRGLEVVCNALNVL